MWLLYVYSFILLWGICQFLLFLNKENAQRMMGAQQLVFSSSAYPFWMNGPIAPAPLLVSSIDKRTFVEKIRLDILGLSSSSQSHVGHYALILGEHTGNRRLPIIIGVAEARAIALELDSLKPDRPMTHDLIRNLVQFFDINLVEVVINDLREGIFFARLVLEQNGELYEVDSRPSDAVAIAVRFQAPIYTYEAVLEEAGIYVEEDDEESESAKYADEEEGLSLTEIEKSDPIEEKKVDSSEDSIDKKIEDLNKKLDDALGKEEYEVAARLRDEINRLKDD